MTKPVYLTKEAIADMEKEKIFLEKEKIPHIADIINRAKELGDLRENFEYHEAKQQMAFAQGRLRDIEQQLVHAVIFEKGGAGDLVRLGSLIEVEKNGSKRSYQIVGAHEAKPAEGLISNESPLGSAFLGRCVGDEVDVETPAGVIRYRVISIS